MKKILSKQDPGEFVPMFFDRNLNEKYFQQKF